MEVITPPADYAYERRMCVREKYRPPPGPPKARWKARGMRWAKMSGIYGCAVRIEEMSQVESTQILQPQLGS